MCAPGIALPNQSLLVGLSSRRHFPYFLLHLFVCVCVCACVCVVAVHGVVVDLFYIITRRQLESVLLSGLLLLSLYLCVLVSLCRYVPVAIRLSLAVDLNVRRWIFIASN